MSKRILPFLAALVLILSLTACGAGEQSWTRTVYTMDTVMNLTAYGKNADAALDSAEELLLALDRQLDRHSEESTVSALNRDGTVDDAALAAELASGETA